MDETRFQTDVVSRLTRLGRRLRSYALAGGVATVMVFALAAGMVQFLLDYTFRLPWDMRAVLLVVIVVALFWMGWRHLWRAWRFPFGSREMACLIEKRHPQLRSVLISAVQFASGHVGAEGFNSPGLVREVVRRARRETASIAFDGVLQRGPVRRSLVVIVAMIGIVVAAFGLRPDLMGIWLDRNLLLLDTRWPQHTNLLVDLPDGVLTGARGDDLEVRAKAIGEVPRTVSIIFEFDSGTSGKETMIGVGENEFRHTFGRVMEPFRFRLKGGDAETPWYKAQLADRPRVESARISVTPPAYAGLEPFVLPEGDRAVETLLGSEVVFDVQINKPVVRAELMSAQAHGFESVGFPAQAHGLQPVGDAWSVTISPTETRMYHFELEDEIGLVNKRPVRLSVRVLKDAAPRVRMEVRGVSDIITAQALLPVELEFSDVYGLARAELIYRIAREEDAAHVVPLEAFNAGAKLFETRLNWPADSVALVAGDRLTLFAEAEDFNDVSGPSVARSGDMILRIVTRDELLGELARREQEYRQEFERALEQQEDLRRQLLTLIGTSRGLQPARPLETSSATSGVEPGVKRELSARVAMLERRQRQIAGQVNLLRQQFEQVLAELEVNGLDTATIRQRLGEGIVMPLTRLAKRDLVTAADLLRQIDRDPGPETAGRADATQVAVLNEMRLILSSMLKWEGFQEAVTMLREILRLQRDLREDTTEEIERRAVEILGGG
ncbi:MAG: hypothetical protein V3W34_05080 [Phycisphaerae bacterium]